MAMCMCSGMAPLLLPAAPTPLDMQIKWWDLATLGCAYVDRSSKGKLRARASVQASFGSSWDGHQKEVDYFGREQFAYGGVVLSGQTTRDTGHFGLFPTRKITPFKWRSPNLWWPWIHYSRVTNGELNGRQMSEISCFVLKSNDIKKQLKCQALTICWITSRFEFIIVE